MSRCRCRSPILDDRSYEQLRDELVAPHPRLRAGVDRPQPERPRHHADRAVRVPRREPALPLQPDPRGDEARSSCACSTCRCGRAAPARGLVAFTTAAPGGVARRRSGTTLRGRQRRRSRRRTRSIVVAGRRCARSAGCSRGAPEPGEDDGVRDARLGRPPARRASAATSAGVLRDARCSARTRPRPAPRRSTSATAVDGMLWVAVARPSRAPTGRARAAPIAQPRLSCPTTDVPVDGRRRRRARARGAGAGAGGRLADLDRRVDRRRRSPRYRHARAASATRRAA